MVGKGEVRGVRAGGWQRRVGHVAAAARHGHRRTGGRIYPGRVRADFSFFHEESLRNADWCAIISRP